MFLLKYSVFWFFSKNADFDEKNLVAIDQFFVARNKKLQAAARYACGGTCKFLWSRLKKWSIATRFEDFCSRGSNPATTFELVVINQFFSRDHKNCTCLHMHIVRPPANFVRIGQADFQKYWLLCCAGLFVEKTRERKMEIQLGSFRSVFGLSQ